MILDPREKEDGENETDEAITNCKRFPRHLEEAPHDPQSCQLSHEVELSPLKSSALPYKSSLCVLFEIKTFDGMQLSIRKNSLYTSENHRNHLSRLNQAWLAFGNRSALVFVDGSQTARDWGQNLLESAFQPQYHLLSSSEDARWR